MAAAVSDAEARLLTVRAEARARLASLTRDVAHLVVARQDSNSDDEHDPEGATLAWDQAQAASLMGQARQQIDEVDAALVRLSAGTYGRCEQCGRPIGSERLAARPAARRCIECESAHARFTRGTQAG